MWSICKKEIAQFFGNISGYIAVCLFFIVAGIYLFVLPDSSVFEAGYARLDTFFDLAPWIFIFLIPALCMRIFPEEFRGGTFEILKTKPVTALQIVIGKYAAVIIILVIIIVPTLIYVYTVQYFSAKAGIDAAGIAGSYVGLFLLSAGFAAISLCCCSFTNNAVIAFLLSGFVCLLIYFGFNALSRLPVFIGGVDYYLEMLGIDFHYRNLSRGVIDSRDVVYFLSVIILAIVITVKNISKKSS